jgi:Fe2+ or Zn2+ uptake regulation protein
MTESRSVENRMADLLKRNHLSVTDSRKKILSLFLQSKDALTHGDIEKKAGEKFDRVTIYRTLQTFVEKGIIHSIPTSDNCCTLCFVQRLYGRPSSRRSCALHVQHLPGYHLPG